MADKEIYIDDTRVGFGKKVSIKRELSTEETDTFDGKLVDSDPNPGVTVSIDTVRAGTNAQYIELEQKLRYAEKNPVTIQIVEKVITQDNQTMIVKDFAYNGLLSSNTVDLEPSTRTAIGVEIKAQSHKRYINGTEIK